jgi:UDP-GlcNAc:undecaprenyl-phosphate GlcNAc-1-phosphate transferase
VLLIIAMMTGQLFIAAMLSIVVGTSLGFLIYNFPNARIFLGDTGSLIFGFFLSVVVVLFTFYQSNSDYPVMTILVPLYLFAVPILDTLWVIFWRMREGVSIFIPDKRHLSHKLMSIGFGKTQAVIFIWLLTIGCGLSGIILYKLQAYFVYLSLAQLLIFLVLVTLILAQKGSK